MYWKRNIGITVLFALFTLLVSSGVLADDADGRINRTPYHFGGDTLYCTEAAGCTLTNITGNELVNWPQSDIGTTFANVDASGLSSMVGDGQGTYGTTQLWAVLSGENNGNKRLCLMGYDEWGKQNDMCFAVTLDYHFQQATLPIAAGVAGATVADCSMWSVGNWVRSIANNAHAAPIMSINTANGTATFGLFSIVPPFLPLLGPWTYGCDEIEGVT